MAQKKTKEQFVKEATEKHNGKYSYEHFIYMNALYKGYLMDQTIKSETQKQMAK